MMKTVLLCLSLAACTNSPSTEDMGTPTDMAQRELRDMASAPADQAGFDLAPLPPDLAPAPPDLAGALLYYYDWWTFESWYIKTYKEKLCEDDQTLQADAATFCQTQGQSFLRFGVYAGSCGTGGPIHNFYSQVVCY